MSLAFPLMLKNNVWAKIGDGLGTRQLSSNMGGVGRTGTVIISSDNWGRSARRYEGFENVEPSIAAVGRLVAPAKLPTLSKVGRPTVTAGQIGNAEMPE